MDLKRLNESVKREQYILPTSDEITAKLNCATVFSSLNAASGFWQIPLHPDSCTLTTFITPFGRFCFKRLPFGIYSATEIFQRKMLKNLQGLEGVSSRMTSWSMGPRPESTMPGSWRYCYVSSQWAWSSTKTNAPSDKVSYTFWSISLTVVRPDPDQVQAIRQLAPPENVHELKIVLGIVNYLGRFVPSLVTIGQLSSYSQNEVPTTT